MRACLSLLLVMATFLQADAQSRNRQIVEAYERVRMEAIAKAEQSVVAIARVRQAARGVAAPRGPNPTSSDFVPGEYASGVMIDSRGFILTTQHVLGDPKKNDYYIFLARKPYRAKVKATDPWLDLAILQIQTTKPRQYRQIAIGDNKKVRKGQTVLALGNPFAIARDGQVSVSQGIISNIGRKAPQLAKPPRGVSKQPTLHHFGTLLQTDAKLNQGTSGGALVNLDGQLVGLITTLAAGARFERAAGFAIPIDAVVRRSIEKLKQGKQPEYGFLGVQTLDLTAEARRNGRFGVRVRVTEGTPASHGGLRDGDIVIRVNSARIFNRGDLTRQICGYPVGTQVDLTFIRGWAKNRRGRQLTQKVMLGKRYVASHRPAFAEIPLPFWRGVQVDYGTAVPVAVLQDLSVRVDPTRTVVVRSVKRESAAWKAGLRQYDYVSHIGDRRILSPRDFFSAVRGKNGAVTLRLANRKDTKREVAGE